MDNEWETSWADALPGLLFCSEHVLIVAKDFPKSLYESLQKGALTQTTVQYEDSPTNIDEEPQYNNRQTSIHRLLHPKTIDDIIQNPEEPKKQVSSDKSEKEDEDRDRNHGFSQKNNEVFF